jgi:hypothetical protein
MYPAGGGRIALFMRCHAPRNGIERIYDSSEPRP